MGLVVDRLPFFEKLTTVEVAGESLSVKPDQIILWMSLTEEGVSQPDPRTPRFPAVLDIGLSHNLAIREEQLTHWAGLYPPLFPPIGHARLNRRGVNLVAAKAWVYRNQPGQRDVLTNHPPFPLHMLGGITVYPSDTPDAPRLPTLGLRALRVAKLHLHIDGERCRVSLRTRRRWWILG